MEQIESKAQWAGQKIHTFEDPISGTTGVIVIDSTALGPAMGGCRLYEYPSLDDAILDARRLARGMSYKNALADISFGGGKAVIRKPGAPFDRKALFLAFARAVEQLQGEYFTAEDVGTSVADMEIMRKETDHVLGLAPGRAGRAGGDPSPWTALGVFVGMRTIAGRQGRKLADMHVAIQGAGHVGQCLAGLLAEAGAKLSIADLKPEATELLAKRYDAQVIPVEQIHRCAADIFAPCALGAVLNADTIPELQAGMVIGAANNQLASERDEEHLTRRGILYAPDYVVNAGGVINVASEQLGESVGRVRDKVLQIGERLTLVLDRARDEGIRPGLAADRMARTILAGRTA